MLAFSFYSLQVTILTNHFLILLACFFFWLLTIVNIIFFLALACTLCICYATNIEFETTAILSSTEGGDRSLLPDVCCLQHDDCVQQPADHSEQEHVRRRMVKSQVACVPSSWINLFGPIGHVLYLSTATAAGCTVSSGH